MSHPPLTTLPKQAAMTAKKPSASTIMPEPKTKRQRTTSAAGGGPSSSSTTTAVDGGVDLSSLFKMDPPVTLNVLSFLSLKDTVNLQLTGNRAVQNFVKDRQDDIYHNLLIQDVCEGRVLKEAFTRSKRSVPCYKSLYRAFLKRFRLQKECPERVAIPWRRPPPLDPDGVHSSGSSTAAPSTDGKDGDHTKLSGGGGEEDKESSKGKDDDSDDDGGGDDDDDDSSFNEYLESQEPQDRNNVFKVFNLTKDAVVDSLVFIIRVADDPEGTVCGFLGWRKDKRRPSDDVLEIREEWYDNWSTWHKGIEYESEDTDTFDLPSLKNALCRKIDRLEENWNHELFREVEDEVLDTYRLTIHAVNIETCQVMTLLEDGRGNDIYDICTLYPKIYGSTRTIPHLYGLPLAGSPFFSNLSEQDYQSMERYWEYENYPKVENLVLNSEYPLGRFYEHGREGEKDYDDHVYMEGGLELSPCETSSLRNKRVICSYIRALMDVKCESVPTSSSQKNLDNVQKGLPYSAEMTQPAWTRHQKVLDLVLSFTSLEEQTMCLRAVSKCFNESILRMLRSKVLDQDRIPIAFDRFEWFGVFRADVRRGWSDEFMNRESVIDWTLLTMGCRCTDSLCADYRSCPDCIHGVSYVVEGKKGTLDLLSSRRLLEANGQFRLTKNFPEDQKRPGRPSAEVSFHKLSKKSIYMLCDIVHSKIEANVQYEIMRGSPLKRDYGVASNEMTLKQFLRSIFIVLASGASYTDGYFPTVTVASSGWRFDDGHDTYPSRMKAIYRFRMPNNEKVEIILENKSMFHR